MSDHIGTLTEKSLHADLKRLYAQPDDGLEEAVEGFVVDIVRGKHLIEIQTGGFTPLKRKFARLLLLGYHVHLVHPIPAQKWIVRQDAEGRALSRRRSPRRGRAVDVFRELVRIPHLLPDPGFTLEVVLTRQEEILRDDGQGSWRRKGWSLHDHRLLEAVDSVSFSSANDYLRYLPGTLPQPFTNRELAGAARIPNHLAQKMTYTLHKAGFLRRSGKNGNAHLYSTES